jgi:hypothetical protein
MPGRPEIDNHAPALHVEQIVFRPVQRIQTQVRRALARDGESNAKYERGCLTREPGKHDLHGQGEATHGNHLHLPGLFVDMRFTLSCRNRCAVFALLALPILPLSAEEAEHGICEDQIAADLKTRFGQKITKVDWSFETSLDSESGMMSRALVYVDGCAGYHVYDIYATDNDCLHRVHYGQIPNYIRYRTSEGGC